MLILLDAMKDLWSHRGRSLLTVLSLVVGVLSVVGVVTVGTIVREVFVAQAEQRNGRAITVSTEIPATVLTERGMPTVLEGLNRRISLTGGSYALTMDVNGQAGTSRGAEQGQAIVLVAGRLDRVKRLPIADGRWLLDDSSVYPGGVVINLAARSQYGGPGSIVTVRLSDQFESYQQRVIGVVADGNSSPTIYQSLSSALSDQPGALPASSSFDLLVHDPSAGEAVLRRVVGDVGVDLGVDPSELEIHRADTVGDLLGNLQATQGAFLGVASLTLVVAALGIMNIGLATVRDRRRELTIRRATGATRFRIFMLVMSSSVITGLTSTVIACASAALTVAFVVPRLLNPESPVQAPGFPYGAALAGLVAALVASVIGGCAPAAAAARIDLAGSLRE